MVLSLSLIKNYLCPKRNHLYWKLHFLSAVKFHIRLNFALGQCWYWVSLKNTRFCFMKYMAMYVDSWKTSSMSTVILQFDFLILLVTQDARRLLPSCLTWDRNSLEKYLGVVSSSCWLKGQGSGLLVRISRVLSWSYSATFNKKLWTFLCLNRNICSAVGFKDS